MTDERKFPPHKPRRSALKRQRTALWIALGGVALLIAALVLALNLAVNRTAIEEGDSKYYILREQGVWVMQDEDGNTLPTTEEGLYETKLGSLYFVDAKTGEWKEIARVDYGSGENVMLDSYNGKLDVLMYPLLERGDIKSIQVVNEKDSFAFEKDKDGYFVIRGRDDVAYNTTMLATLIAVTGYTRTQMRLDMAKVERLADGSVDYAAYGLPAEGDTPKNYFVITANDGTEHKVLIGNITIPETGYYAQYEGRADIYILKQLDESEYNSTLSGTLLCALEEYVTPFVSVTVGTSNYFDVTDFVISAVQGGIPREIVKFSYEPIEKRLGTYYSYAPYISDGVIKGFNINDKRVDECLLMMQSLNPQRVVLLDRNNSLDEEAFIARYGIAYAIEYTYNGSRAGESDNYDPIADKQVMQRILISPATEEGTYYLYNELYDMVVEVEVNDLQFLTWSTFQWVSFDMFTGHIGHLKEMTVSIPGGTTAGLTGLHSLAFRLNNSGSQNGGKPDENGNIDTSGLVVWGDHDGVTNKSVSLTQFSSLYRVLLFSTIEKIADVGEAARDEAIAAGPALEITVKYDAAGETLTQTYRFYHYNGAYSFVTLNGEGNFFVLRDRVEKIIGDMGLVFTQTAIS